MDPKHIELTIDYEDCFIRANMSLKSVAFLISSAKHDKFTPSKTELEGIGVLLQDLSDIMQEAFYNVLVESR